MRQGPGWEGIGRETLVNQGQRRNAARVLQIEIVLTDLIGQQQPLINDRPRRHRRLIKLLAVLQTERPDGVGRPAADDVELALQRIGHHHVRSAADEHLSHHRLQRTHGGRHGHRAVDGNIAPAQNHLPFGADRPFDSFLTGQPGRRFLGQKDHAHTVIAGTRQRHALLGHLLAQKLVGNLDQYPGTISHQGVGTDRAAMIEIFQDQKSLLDDRMTLFPFDVRHEAHTAGIVFVGRVIQPLPFRQRRIHHARILIET